MALWLESFVPGPQKCPFLKQRVVGELPLPVLVLNLRVSGGLAPQFALDVDPMLREGDGQDEDWPWEVRLGVLQLGLLVLPFARQSS